MAGQHMTGLNPTFRHIPAASSEPQAAQTAQKKPQPDPQHFKQNEQHSTGFPGALLQKLLPKEFDDGDLLILLILFLIMREEHRDPTSMIVAAMVYFSSGGNG